MASPGISGLREEDMGLLKGHTLRIILDQDVAGRGGAFGYKEIRSSYYGTSEENIIGSKKFPLDTKGIEEYEYIVHNLSSRGID
jgi:hypothetical protein